MIFHVTTGERPPTLNRERGEHWTWKARQTDAWRTAAAESLQRLGFRERTHAMPAARFAFRPLYPTDDRRVLPDTGNCYPAEKAIVDGAVDLGLIPDDTPFHNAGQLTLPPLWDPSIDVPLIEVEVISYPVPTTTPWGEPLTHVCTCRRDYLTKQTRAELARNRK